MSAMDVDGAVGLLATHGRVCDRRRLDSVLGRGSVEAVPAAVDGFRNADGGCGGGRRPVRTAPNPVPPPPRPVAPQHSSTHGTPSTGTAGPAGRLPAARRRRSGRGRGRGRGPAAARVPPP